MNVKYLSNLWVKKEFWVEGEQFQFNMNKGHGLLLLKLVQNRLINHLLGIFPTQFLSKSTNFISKLKNIEKYEILKVTMLLSM